MSRNQGFTLIELVIVIVILGILAVYAIPRFVDLSGSADTASLKGVAAALSSANAENYAVRKVNGIFGVSISNCTNVANALTNSLPANYSITSASVAVNVTSVCTLTYTPSIGSSVSTSFLATGIN